ncbi:unnamed protein product [Schistosoma margrebowiei]|uniref:Uncharacterized protein n=1 Tax=Schistosoma margrebowiei TaxID=48269 RepID=A0A183MFD6_9TREM|nr:unnamed protein product [Schistosoma margrebowiei]
MVVGGSRQETLEPGVVLIGTRQQGALVILRELVLPGGFDLVSPSFTVRDVITMVVGGSRQETLDPGFVILGTHQQGIPLILRDLVFPDEFDLGSPSFTVRDVTLPHYNMVDSIRSTIIRTRHA